MLQESTLSKFPGNHQIRCVLVDQCLFISFMRSCFILWLWVAFPCLDANWVCGNSLTSDFTFKVAYFSVGGSMKTIYMCVIHAVWNKDFS